jgi:hypothetical protein
MKRDVSLIGPFMVRRERPCSFCMFTLNLHSQESRVRLVSSIMLLQ